MSSWKGAADGRSARREPLVPRRCLVIRTARRGLPKSSQWRPAARGRLSDRRAKTAVAGQFGKSMLRFLRDLKSIVDFDTEIPHRAFQLAVPE
jgi:hypothetical protein